MRLELSTSESSTGVPSSGATSGGFRDLKLDLQRRKLADAKTFVALGDGLAFADVTADDDAGEGSVDAGLVKLRVPSD